jgi:hypothetical protein
MATNGPKQLRREVVATVPLINGAREGPRVPSHADGVLGTTAHVDSLQNLLVQVGRFFVSYPVATGERFPCHYEVWQVKCTATLRMKNWPGW